MASRKPLTEKNEVKRWVNKNGYEYLHPKTGKEVKVGRYRKTMKVYPKTYRTWIKDHNGEYREAIARKGTKNGKPVIYYKFIDDQRKAKLIPLNKAEKHFEGLPEKQKTADRRFTAKNQLKIIEKDGEQFVKESYLTKTGTSRYDIKGIDTKIDDWREDWEKAKEIQEKYKKASKKASQKEGFYEEFYFFEERENRRNELKGRIKFLEMDLKYTPHKEKVIKEIEACKKELEDLGDIKWQKEPKDYYYKEIDPRYSKLHKEKRLEYATLKNELAILKDKIKTGRTADERYRLLIEIEEKADAIKQREEELKSMDRESKYIYWNDKLIEATINDQKEIPSEVVNQMPEKFKERYQRMQEIKEAKKKREQRKSELEHEKRLSKAKAKEKALKEADEILPEIQERFSKNVKGKLNKEIWKEQPISEFGDMKGIMDPSRITLLTTNEQMKYNDFGKQFKEHEKVDFEQNEMIMDRYGFQYNFNPKDGCTYNQEYVDLALKSMKNPEIYYKKDTPLMIKDDTYTYVIAPRVQEEEIDFDDDDDYWGYGEEKTKEKDFDTTIKLTPVRYREMMKTQKKEEMIDEYNRLQGRYGLRISFEGQPEKMDKHELLYNLILKKREIQHLNKEDIKDYQTEKKETKQTVKEKHDLLNKILEKESQLKREQEILEKELNKTKTNTKKWDTLIARIQGVQKQRSDIIEEREDAIYEKDKAIQEYERAKKWEEEARQEYKETNKEKGKEKQKTKFPEKKIMEDDSVYTFKKQFNNKDEAWKLAKEIGYARVEKMGDDYAVYISEAMMKKKESKLK